MNILSRSGLWPSYCLKVTRLPWTGLTVFRLHTSYPPVRTGGTGADGPPWIVCWVKPWTVSGGEGPDILEMKLNHPIRDWNMAKTRETNGARAQQMSGRSNTLRVVDRNEGSCGSWWTWNSWTDHPEHDQEEQTNKNPTRTNLVQIKPTQPNPIEPKPKRYTHFIYGLLLWHHKKENEIKGRTR